MQIETRAAHDLDNAGSNARYDAECKRLLANKIFLAWIMKSCLDEYRDCTIEDIENIYIEGMPELSSVGVDAGETNREAIVGVGTEDNVPNEGVIFYDIRFMASAPGDGDPIRIIVNIEAQNSYKTGYPLIKRAIYYCARMISAQKTVEFSGKNYQNIKKVYSIWICMSAPDERKNTITRYSIKEQQMIGNASEKVQDYDLMTAIMICLGKPDQENYGGILELLEVLLTDRIEPNEKKKLLEENFEISFTRKIEGEVERMCNLSQGIEDRGIQKGIEKGEFIATLSAIKSLIETTGWSIQQAMNALHIPQSEQAKYADQI